MTGTAAYILAMAKAGGGSSEVIKEITNKELTESAGKVWTTTDEGAGWKKSLTTIYEAGDGIEIIGDVAVSDELPVKLYGNSRVLSQYIIYGAESGVGNYNSSTGKYDIPINITAADESAGIKISLDTPLYADSYIDYQEQALISKKTKIAVGNLDANCIREDGSLGYIGWSSTYMSTDYIPVTPTHEISLYVPTGSHETARQMINTWYYHGFYDANKNPVSTFKPTLDTEQLVVVPEGAAYIKLMVVAPLKESIRIYDLTPSKTPVTLPQIAFYPDVINTIDVKTTVKPSKVMFEVDTSDTESGEEGGVRVVGKIYNRGLVRKVLTLSTTTPNTLKDENGDNVSFDALLALIREESNYVVILYGNSKLRPQYVSDAEIHCDGADRDSVSTFFLRMVMTASRLDIQKTVIYDERDLTQAEYDALTDAQKTNGIYYNIIEG